MKKSISYLVITITAAGSLACASASAKTDNSNTRIAQAETAGQVRIQTRDVAFETDSTIRPLPTPAAVGVEPINDEPAKLVREFYAYYLDGFPSVDEERVNFAKYLTGKLLSTAIDTWDGDVFLDAQDLDGSWKENFTVSRALVSGNKATVNVNLRGETFKWTLKVSLVKERSVWKIAGVRNVQN